ncbi:MAG: M1 family metallopeptidase [Corallococcus sp.]|nr:M1 family metallopeptidase [Corallococcus sp.]
MKKLLSVLCIALLCVSLFAFVGCDGNYLNKIADEANNYQIVCGYDAENHKLSAVQTVTVTHRGDETVTDVKFHIYANQYRNDAQIAVVPASYFSKAYYNGESYGDIAFDSVKVDGEAVAFTIEGEDMDILSVPLGKELFPNETVTIEMSYEIQLANVKHRLGYGDNTVNLGNFYPVLCRMEQGAYKCTPYYAVGDPYVTDMANYDVTITVPAGYTVASSGNLAEMQADEQNSTIKYTANAVRDFAIVLSNKYQKLTQQVGDVTLNYYYFADETPQTTLATALGMLNFMQQKVAKYPYSQLSIAETDFCYGGMEYPNMVMVSSGTNDYQTATAHEVAHQWFYGLVGNDQIENAWMDEGLTEFFTMLYLDDCKTTELSMSVKRALKSYTTYVDILGNYHGSLDLSFRPVYRYKTDSEYVYMTYVKGSLMFYSLYDAMGSAKFYKAVGRYFDECKGSVAVPQQMHSAFAAVSGEEVVGIFKAYAEGKEVIGEGGR